MLAMNRPCFSFPIWRSSSCSAVAIIAVVRVSVAIDVGAGSGVDVSHPCSERQDLRTMQSSSDFPPASMSRFPVFTGQSRRLPQPAATLGQAFGWIPGRSGGPAVSDFAKMSRKIASSQQPLPPLRPSPPTQAPTVPISHAVPDWKLHRVGRGRCFRRWCQRESQVKPHTVSGGQQTADRQRTGSAIIRRRGPSAG